MLQSKNEASNAVWYWIQYLIAPWRIIHQLQKENKRLREVATQDPLTGALNRHGLKTAFLQEVGALQRDHFKQGGEVHTSVVVIDLDRFKSLNDMFGHDAGDQVLQAFVDILREFLRRPSDIIARTGGDEFVIVLPETHLAGACWRIRKCLYAMRKDPRFSRDDLRVTASIGLAQVDLKAEEDLELALGTAIAFADQACYRSKKRGRNRISVNRIRDN